MLTLLLAESALERVPESLWSYPVISATAKRRNKKPSEILLDSSLHHTAMRTLPDSERRGRPDIIHISLLVAMDSILNKKNMLRVVIHTQNNEVISINPSTRIIKNYDRFVGLMEQLFQQHFVPDEHNPLFILEKECTLQEIIKRYDADRVIGFDTGCNEVKLPLFFKDLKKQKQNDLLCIIGGFPKGNFSCNVKKQVDDVISIYPEMVPAWTVTSEIIVNYENVFASEKKSRTQSG